MLPPTLLWEPATLPAAAALLAAGWAAAAAAAPASLAQLPWPTLFPKGMLRILALLLLYRRITTILLLRLLAAWMACSLPDAC